MSVSRFAIFLLVASTGFVPPAHADRPAPIHRSGMEQSTCPNGQIEDAEQCDDNNAVNGDGCPTNCRLIQCGDGAKEPAEDCDDGSTGAGDGCGGEFCEITTGWLCGPIDIGDPSSTSVCTPDCGDGLIVGSEQCDLSNLNGQTCQTLGFASGTLACNAQCQFDDSACRMPTPPVAGDDTVVTNEDTALQISASSLLANDSDANGDLLTIVAASNAVNGIVSLNAGTLQFTPAPNFYGTASFDYTVSDGTASDVGRVTVNIASVNDGPIANAVSTTTNEDTSVVVTLSGSDIDSFGLTFSVPTAPGHGTLGSITQLTPFAASVTYTPNADFNGSDSFTYIAHDGQNGSAPATVTITVIESPGAASSPFLSAQRAVLALAHGTGGISVPFPIMSWLTDRDGTESLSLKISGVPTGLSFNAGTNLGGGVWQFSPADLPNLTLNLPGSYTTLATHLTVQATATESANGATASTSTIVTLKAAYTTVDVTLPESGSYTGSSASEFIQGGAGNNTINGSSGNNIVNGNGGDDTLSAATGSDQFHGGSGADTIDAGSGTDIVVGGSGNDTLTGGSVGESFVDVFVWRLGDQNIAGSPYTDTIQNFATAAAGSNTTGGDVLNLRDLLVGAQIGGDTIAGNLADYLHFEISGGSTLIHISHTGGFAGDAHVVGGSFSSSAVTQIISLAGVNLQSLYSGATMDAQLIVQLFNNSKLVTQ